MKKYLSLLLALLVALSCTSLAFAAEEDEEEISPEMKELGEYIMNHQAEAFDLAVEGYTCQSEKVEAELLTDGTVNVTEYWTYSCRNFEKMTKFERTLAKSEDYEISDIRVVMWIGADVSTATRRFRRRRKAKGKIPGAEVRRWTKPTRAMRSTHLENWNATTTIKVLYTVKGLPCSSITILWNSLGS
ncbi:MAG: hypothetical protein ACLS8R_02615 [Anaeromassilibacillus sp.]